MMQTNDCVQRVLDLLPSHWDLREESNNHKLIEIICNRSDNEYQALNYIYDMWHIDTAEGIHLDNIGRDVGLGRNGMSDDRYRRLLKVKEYLDLSHGTIPEIDTILDAFLEGDYIGVQDGWQGEIEEPASIIVHVTKNAHSLPFEIAKLAKSGGIKIYYEATFDELTITLYWWEYEHKVFYPITNIEHTGYQKGYGERVLFYWISDDYEHKVFYPHVNIGVTKSNLVGIGERQDLLMVDKSYQYKSYSPIVSISTMGAML